MTNSSARPATASPKTLIAEQNIFSKAPDEQFLDPFVHSLSTEHRKMLAEMIHRQRIAAIHDVLAVLSWWVTARNVAFTYRGEPMPVELSDAGLHGDYVGRLTGWEWPEDGPAGS